LVFDLDDTLYLESSYFLAIFSTFCLQRKWPDNAFTPLIENFRHLRLNQKDIFGFFLEQNRSLIENNNTSGTAEDRESLHNALFSLYTGIKTYLQPMDGVAEWLDFARRNSLKVGVLTNGVVAAQRNKWACLDISGKDHITFLPARECKREKPGPDSFHAISQSLDIEMQQITFVGDCFEKDLAYPLSQGATGILLCQEPVRIPSDEGWFHTPDLLSALSTLVQKREGK